MTTDLIDRAFLHRLGTSAVPQGHRDLESTRPQVESHAWSGEDDPVAVALLERYPERWTRLADRVAAAWMAGERIVAVAGRGRGAGCSTVVFGLTHVLRRRGMIVTRVDGTACGSRDVDSGDGIVVVDAGVWFGAGPIHRGRLAKAAAGCQAAVLVRRASSSPSNAHGAALEAIGVHVLGEVVTHADPPSSTCETPVPR